MRKTLALLSLVAITLQATAASFDCRKAGNDTERAICAHPGLSALDSEFAANYQGVIGAMSGPGFLPGTVATVKAEQRHWLKQRNGCGANVACIAKSYEARNDAMCEFGMPSGPHPCTRMISSEGIR